MFPRGGNGPGRHQSFFNGLFPQTPSSASSPRFHFDHQTQQTHVNNLFNNFNGPAHLPVYQWKQTVLPLPSPPVANSRKRQHNSHSPHHLSKRQRVETHVNDGDCPSFEFPSTNQPQLLHQAITGMLLPSPPAHSLEERNTPETSSSLQSFTKDKVSAQMVELFEACQQQQSDLHQKEMYRAQLQRDIQHVYPDARLYMTGSSMSGLGCRSSDADLCLVLNSKKWEAISTLSTLFRYFKALAYVDRTVLIRATVPILRFKKAGSNLEFDLNINNTVGIRNTFLLRSYTYADIRIRPLMLVIKKWARHCEINDASKGTLSSYTLALMVLNYLQCVKPPVLPSLQTDHPAHFDPSLELDMIPGASLQVPRYKSKNQSSLSELFVGFLEYYSSKFRWDSQIISVRAARVFPKNNSPEWRNKFICVEEPFEKRNVARAVHKKEQFDTIKAKFAESYRIFSQKKDLASLLPLRAIIQKEQSVK